MCGRRFFYFLYVARLEAQRPYTLLAPDVWTLAVPYQKLSIGLPSRDRQDSKYGWFNLGTNRNRSTDPFIVKWSTD